MAILKHCRTALVWLILVGILYGLFSVWSAYQLAITRERHLHAMYNVISACQSYLEENDGSWPQSWGDLEPLFPDERPWDERERIDVDFNADPADLAKQEVDAFTGITSKGPIWESFRDTRLKDLIELLKSYHAEQDERDASQED